MIFKAQVEWVVEICDRWNGAAFGNKTVQHKGLLISKELVLHYSQLAWYKIMEVQMNFLHQLILSGLLLAALHSH